MGFFNRYPTWEPPVDVDLHGHAVPICLSPFWTFYVLSITSFESCPFDLRVCLGMFLEVRHIGNPVWSIRSGSKKPTFRERLKT